MRDKLSVILADTSDLLLIGAWAALLRQGNIEVEAALDDFDLLLSESAIYQPNIIFFDERLSPELDTYQMLTSLQSVAPRSKLLVLGNLQDGLFMRDLFHAGASAYLYKQDNLADYLPIAISTVLRHRQYLSPTANAEYLLAMQSPQRDWKLDHELRDVLRLLAKGQRIRDIAEALALETRHVYWLRQKLRKRFGAETNEQLISIAAAEGFIYG